MRGHCLRVGTSASCIPSYFHTHILFFTPHTLGACRRILGLRGARVRLGHRAHQCTPSATATAAAAGATSDSAAASAGRGGAATMASWSRGRDQGASRRGRRSTGGGGKGGGSGDCHCRRISCLLQRYCGVGGGGRGERRGGGVVAIGTPNLPGLGASVLPAVLYRAPSAAVSEARGQSGGRGRARRGGGEEGGGGSGRFCMGARAGAACFPQPSGPGGPAARGGR